MKTIKPTAEESDAIKVVIYNLARYKGETVIAYDHPLHASVRELEYFCRKKRIEIGHDTLHPPAKWYWYHLLWSSRPGYTNFKIPKVFDEDGMRRCSRMNMIDLKEYGETSDRNPKLAMKWAVLLESQLKKWLNNFPMASNTIEMKNV